MSYKLMKYLNEEGTKATPATEAYLDGYSFGDRFLEGVTFRITVDDEGQVQATCPDPANQSYLKSCHVDMGSLLKTAAEAAIGTDCLASTSAGTDDDAFIWDGKKDLGFEVVETA